MGWPSGAPILSRCIIAIPAFLSRKKVTFADSNLPDIQEIFTIGGPLGPLSK
jgi:hypothetical protein